MLDECLNYLCSRLNQSIKSTFEVSDDIALVSPPLDIDGAKASKRQNKIIVFISNLEKDPFSKLNPNQGGVNLGRATIKNKPLFLTLTVAVAANFTQDNYTDGLKLLSHVMAYFHRNNFFNGQNAPDLPANIEQITLEMESIPGDQINQMWGVFGSQYLPSCLYRVRAQVPDSESILGQAGRIHLTHTNVKKEMFRW
ncbi:DUF4255 domain-containing protein [Vibrio eleionomae]|nr:DUF4255 domain-containing protein [Vibrio eleionomae]